MNSTLPTNTTETSVPSKPTAAFLRKQGNHLRELKDRILGINTDKPTEGGTGDVGDLSNRTFEMEYALSVLSKNTSSVRLIDKALKKIDEGTYGVCELCNHPIAPARLEAIPFCELDVECQGRVEKNGMRPVDNVLGFGFSSEEEALSDE